MDFKSLLGKELLFFDGATGTMLQARGLRQGELPELWNFTHPEIVEEIHRAYLDVGSNIVKSNTFGANRLKFSGDGLRPDEIIQAAVAIARRACAGREKAFVALNLGPTGRLLAPFGDLDFEEAVDIYAEMVRSGREAGADLILIETMGDTYEIKAALLAAKENCDLPVLVTMTFDAGGRLLTGGSVEAAVAMAEALGADAAGFNCGLGPEQLRELLPRMLRASSLPIIVNPNAGLPVTRNGTACYDLGAEEFADLMYKLVREGVSVAGGCCGTTPAHLEAMISKCRDLPAGGRRQSAPALVSSYGRAVELGRGPVIIGERINPTGKPRLKEALRSGDFNYICRLGLEQAEAGAQLLDVNVGLPGVDEADAAARAVVALQSVTDTPLQVDTADTAAMERALRLYNGKPLLNSVSGKEASLKKVLPLAKKYGAAVVGLLLDDDGIPTTAAGRLAIAEKIISRAAACGIEQRDILIDPLAMTISTGSDNAATALAVIREMKKRGISTVLGVSNISFGLPGREGINSVFFSLALAAGLTCAIINPQSKAMMDVYYAYRALSGLDAGCMEYTAHHAALPEGAQAAAPVGELDLYSAIVKGLAGESAGAAAAALAKETPLSLIDRYLIPALDDVGRGFEEKRVFLPQLLMSADAARAAFDVLRTRMAGRAAVGNGATVVIATVRGDIHDIGKNIVRALLENYGYHVVDLGKDVPAAAIVQAAREHGAALVGLSALMTTTVGAMEETIQALRQATSCKVIVGGAVLTEEYAAAIGADSYAPNAVSAVHYANAVLGSRTRTEA